MTQSNQQQKPLDCIIPYVAFEHNPEKGLYLPVQSQLPDSSVHTLQALVDTGCPVSLIQTSSVPFGALQQAPVQRQFASANGKPMNGGTEGVLCHLTFLSATNQHGWTKPFSDVFCYAVDIACPMLLGYSFLLENNFSVHPRAQVIMTPKVTISATPHTVSTITDSVNTILPSENLTLHQDLHYLQKHSHLLPELVFVDYVTSKVLSKPMHLFAVQADLLLPGHELEEFRASLLTQYSSVFASPSKVPPSHGTLAIQLLPGTVPWKQKFYRLVGDKETTH